jgi:hypothetical protein
MRYALVALLLVVTACFPHNARHRKIAKWSEGGALAAGIVMLSVANTGADCTGGPSARDSLDGCRRNATLIGDVGLALILGGLVGFGITQMTTPEETAPPPKPLAAQADPDAPKPTLPGRAATTPSR